jgi:inosose dehydratase
MPVNRRHFLLAAAAAAVRAAERPRIRFAASGFIWQENIDEAVRTAARFGFAGLEPFRQHLTRYLERPLELKQRLDAAGLSLVTCSNGGNMTTDFIDPAKSAQTVEDHVKFAEGFLRHFGCRHFKINLGRRPPVPTTDDQLKTMADGLNRLGRRLAPLGIKLAPHPHIWSPLERESEVRRVMELTDPEYVGLVTDTAHLTLGGMDPLAIIRDLYPRVTALHFKDTEPKYKGHRGATPTPEEHRKVNLYKNLGAGGVDFPGIMRLLGDRGFDGWITLDLDPPRPDEGTIEQNLEVNRTYLRDRLHVKL